MPSLSKEQLSKTFDAVGELVEGFRVIREKPKDGKRGMCLYLTTDNQEAFLGRRFFSASDFKDGVAVVEIEVGVYAYWLATDNFTSEERYLMAGPFIRDRARVAQMQNGKRVEFHIRRDNFKPAYNYVVDWVSAFCVEHEYAEVGTHPVIVAGFITKEATQFRIDINGGVVKTAKLVLR